MGKALVPFLVVAALASVASGAPHAEIRDGKLVLSHLPDILGGEDVRPHLTKGLTTTVMVRVELVTPSRQKLLGGAHLQIRYDLWEEVFLVQLMDAAGNRESRTLAGFDELADYWSGLQPTVLADAPSGPGSEAKVEIAVIPFSETEQNDAQRWFTRSLQRAGRSGADSLANPDNDAAETLSRTFHLLMATSIHREPLASRRFTLPVVVGSP